MPRNGSGSYSQPVPNFVAGTIIDEGQVNSWLGDLGSEIQNSIAADGRTPPTADLPMATFKHTGVGNATARAQYLTMAQAQDGAATWRGTAGGTADAITITTSPITTAYAAGEVHTFVTPGANTGAVTVNINALGAKALKTASGDALVAGDLPASAIVAAVYDGTAFRIAAQPFNGGQLAGTRNRIINGGMLIDQRNAGAAKTFTAGAALAYAVDRWYGYCTGANVTGQRVTGAVANTFRYRFTGAASVTAIGFGQRIEAANSADFAGTTVTFGVDLANSLLTSVTWTAYYANTTDTFGTLASPTRTQIATGTFTVTSTVTRYSAQISVPAAATTGIEIVLTVGAQTSGTWTIGDIQLEVGSAGSPFERRHIGTELALCQRYYQVVNVSEQAPSAANSGSTWSGAVAMRAAPTAAQLSAGTAIDASINQLVVYSSQPAGLFQINASVANGAVFNASYALSAEL